MTEANVALDEIADAGDERDNLRLARLGAGLAGARSERDEELGDGPPRGQVERARPADERVDLVRSIPFALVHLAAIATPFITGFPWQGIALALALYFVRMFAITAGYHRYFAHRAYKTSRIFQFCLAFVGTLSLQKGVLWWAANHRHHHRYSDMPEDVHSPRKGFWWSHWGWILSSKYLESRHDKIRDFARYPELRWLDRFYLVPPIAMGVLLGLVAGVDAVLWGLCVSTVFVWHATFAINSVAHLFGRQRYRTGDDSRNSMLLALLTMGEGWHNNHHHHQASANQGWFWWEVDLSYYILRGLAAVGVVWDLRLPSQEVKDRNRVVPVALAAEAAAGDEPWRREPTP